MAESVLVFPLQNFHLCIFVSILETQFVYPCLHFEISFCMPLLISEILFLLWNLSLHILVSILESSFVYHCFHSGISICISMFLFWNPSLHILVSVLKFPFAYPCFHSGISACASLFPFWCQKSSKIGVLSIFSFSGCILLTLWLDKCLSCWCPGFDSQSFS